MYWYFLFVSFVTSFSTSYEVLVIGLWCFIFRNDEDEVEESSEDDNDDDLFVNPNHRPVIYQEEESSSEDEVTSDEEENEKGKEQYDDENNLIKTSKLTTHFEQQINVNARTWNNKEDKSNNNNNKIRWQQVEPPINISCWYHVVFMSGFTFTIKSKNLCTY